MKKVFLIAAALGALTLPALAQQGSGTGQSAGGPARVGNPGQIGGGVPGTQPAMSAERDAMMKKPMRKPRKMRRARPM